MKRLALIGMALALLSVGCTATSQVKYHENDDNKENYIPFALLGSRVTITPSPAAAAGEKGGQLPDLSPTSLTLDEFQAKAKSFVTPTQAKSTVYYMEPQQSWWRLYNTNLSVTYYDGMKVPKSLGVAVQDNTIKVLQSFGALAGAAGTILAKASTFQQAPPKPEASKISVPIILDFSESRYFGITGQSECQPLPKQEDKYCYIYELTPKEGRPEITREVFYSANTGYTNKFPFSRCVDISIEIWAKSEIKPGGKALASFNTTIADPLHVDWLPLPPTGSIQPQSTCGADTTTAKTDTNVFDTIQEVGKQVDAVWKAWHPKK